MKNTAKHIFDNLIEITKTIFVLVFSFIGSKRFVLMFDIGIDILLHFLLEMLCVACCCLMGVSSVKYNVIALV